MAIFFALLFSSKFSPATTGNIDCNLSLFYLPKDDKKAADIFFYHRLKTQVIKFLFLLHKTPPICIRRQKNPCDFGFLKTGSFFARIIIPIIKFLVDFI